MAGWAAVVAQVLAIAMPVLTYTDNGRPDGVDRGLMVVLSTFLALAVLGLWLSYIALSSAGSADAEQQRKCSVYLRIPLQGLAGEFGILALLMLNYSFLGGLPS